jgi:hypothetical protein
MVPIRCRNFHCDGEGDWWQEDQSETCHFISVEFSRQMMLGKDESVAEVM